MNLAVERLSPLIALVGSAVTIGLTIYNNETKTQIDAAEARLKNVQADVAVKVTAREDLKEKVARLTWVRTLLPDLLDDKDEKKRNFTISLVKQILDEREANELFTSLQASSNKELRAVGQSGLNAIQNEQAQELAKRISQINAPAADLRKRTVFQLIEKYKSSADAISLVLRLYDDDRINELSPSGVINGLVFLSATDPKAWNPEQVKSADQLLARLKSRQPGPQTLSEVANLEKHQRAVKAAGAGD